jgi:hypothetical protein
LNIVLAVYLGRKGLGAEVRFERMILASLTKQKPTKYSEIWKQCNRRGMGSKETLSRYLRLLLATGMVMDEGNGYRVNPLSDHPRLNELAKELRRPSRQARRDWRYSYFTPPGPRPVSEMELLDMVQAEFNAAFRIYSWLLTKLVQLTDGTAAEELVEIFMKSEINPILSELAKNVWLARKPVPVDVLKSKRVALLDQ